jgi:hypothetical protein
MTTEMRSYMYDIDMAYYIVTSTMIVCVCVCGEGSYLKIDQNVRSSAALRWREALGYFTRPFPISRSHD